MNFENKSTSAHLSPQDYQDALDAQSACNLSGIIHSWSKVMPKIWATAHELGKGTDWVNQHPICVLYTEQAKHLTTLSGDRYSMAYSVCIEITDGFRG
jgi:hypothetical protein